MTLRQLKKQARQQILKVHQRKTVITKVALWYWMMITDHGRRAPYLGDEGRMFFYNNPFGDNPWAQRLAELKPNQKSPRVLITGTNAEVRAIMQGSRSAAIQQICTEHGLKNYRLDFASRIVFFWDHFYAADNFFTAAAQDIPSIIIMTGAMRNYSNTGGETMDVSDRLKEIANAYQIPTASIEPSWK